MPGEPLPEARLLGRPVRLAAAGFWLAALAMGAAGVTSFLRHEAAELSREVASRCVTTAEALNQTLLRTLEAMGRLHSLEQSRQRLLGRVFEPFFTTKASDMGTGRAICQSAMRGFGGDIRVRNGADGAEFTLEFPLAGPVP